MKRYAAALIVLALPAVAHAQDKKDDGGGGMAFLFLVAPLAVLLVFLAVIFWRSGAMRQGDFLTKAAAQLDRNDKHMAIVEKALERQEEQTRRVIELLESIERELKHHEGIQRA